MSVNHSTRKHSPFSASGAERWINCPGSVSLSEGLPDKDSVWSLEGTKAHEVLEWLMRKIIENKGNFEWPRGSKEPFVMPIEMRLHALNAANFILGLYKASPRSEILVETRIHLPFIAPEMFGTFDGAVVDYFGVLHVFDYKYGAGHAVSPVENLQMIFYGLGLAAKYDWNFKKVRLWIIQPRIKGYDGPLFWELGILELKKYIQKFQEGYRRAKQNPKTYVEGSWCHWCKAKTLCPLKQQGKLEKAMSLFSATPIKRK